MLALTRWAWRSPAPLARIARVPLHAAAGLMGLAVRARAAAYARGWRRSRPLPAPSIAVGNLVVGGTGKTPVASWIAGHFLACGQRPGILLRGGRAWGDEAQVHRALMPEAIVVENRDRSRGALEAVERGAGVLVLDDAFQRLDIRTDLRVLLVSADSFTPPRLLPAGAWREGLSAATRADFIVITRKAAPAAAVSRCRAQMEAAAPLAQFASLELRLDGLVPLSGGPRMPLTAIAGAAVVASAGIADHDSFAAQLRHSGASVDRLDWRDHHRYSLRDIGRIVEAGRRADRVVVTEKDAIKLRPSWPRDEREPLVAALAVRWETGAQRFITALDRLRASRRAPHLHPDDT